MPSFSKLALVITTALSLSSISLAQNVPAFQYGTPNPNAPGVKGRNSNGPTNPDSPKLGTPVNQTSESRLASVNSVDDWCTFGPKEPGQPIGNIEAEVVAWCTKPRNNARVIPDGTLTATHFVKTPLYVQVMALGDFTKMNIMAGDDGGELDPHGATNMGNPIGGNVTSNVSGQDVFYEEWMSFVSYNQVCIRVCIAGTDIAPTPLECQHELDVMGCNWVMPGDYSDNKFDSCDGDAAYPPGLYPINGGSDTSTFHQYFSSVYVDGSGNSFTFVNGSPDQATPSAAYSLPATSNCQTTSSVGNGIASLSSAAASSSATSMSSSAVSSGASSTRSSSSATRQATSAGSSGSSGAIPMVNINFSAILAVVGAVAGGVALL